MSNEQAQLTGHYSVLIDDESWTFPIPAFADTLVRGWGPGKEGEYEVSFYPPERFSAWVQAKRRHEATLRRWGWLRRVGRLGHRLAARLIADYPIPGGTGLVTENVANFHVLEETFNCTFTRNSVVGWGLLYGGVS